MSFYAMAWVKELNVRPSSLKFTLFCYAYHANDETGYCYPSVPYVAEFTSQDRKTVMANIAMLAELGFLEDTERRVGRTRQVVVYRFKSPEIGTLSKLGQTDPKTGLYIQPNSPVFPWEQSRFSLETVPKTGPGKTTEQKGKNKNPPNPPAAQAGKVKKTRSARQESDGFKELKAIYPNRAGTQRYDDANRFYEQHLADGDTHEMMKAGIERYAKLMAYERKIGTGTVMQMATFLGSNRAYLESYDIPVEAPKETPKERLIRERREAVLEVRKKGLAAGVDFRVAFNHESLDEYQQALQAAIDQKRRIDSGEVKQRSLHDVVGATRQMPKEK